MFNKNGKIKSSRGFCKICGEKIPYNDKRYKYCSDECNKRRKIKEMNCKVIKDTVEKYCILNENLSIRKEDLISIFPENYNYMSISLYLSKNFDIVSTNNIYFGIGLNKNAWKTFLPEKTRKQAILENKGNELDHKQACRLISCSPTIELFKSKYKKHFSSEENNKIIHNIKQIEKLMYKLNIYKKLDIKIGLGIYISTNLNQTEVSKLANITTSSLGTLYNKLKLNEYKGVNKRNERINKVNGVNEVRKRIIENVNNKIREIDERNKRKNKNKRTNRTRISIINKEEKEEYIRRCITLLKKSILHFNLCNGIYNDDIYEMSLLFIHKFINLKDFEEITFFINDIVATALLTYTTISKELIYKYFDTNRHKIYKIINRMVD